MYGIVAVIVEPETNYKVSQSFNDIRREQARIRAKRFRDKRKAVSSQNKMPGGFYEERIISILEECDTCMTSKDIWIKFEHLYHKDLKKMRGKSKQASLQSALSVLTNKRFGGVRRIVKKQNMRYNVGHYYIKRDSSYYANILLNLRDS